MTENSTRTKSTPECYSHVFEKQFLRAPMLNRNAILRSRKLSAITRLAIFVALAGMVVGANSRLQARHRPAPIQQIWVATWGSSQQIPEPQNALPPDDLRDATIRQIVHLSVGGTALRLHLS